VKPPARNRGRKAAAHRRRAPSRRRSGDAWRALGGPSDVAR